MGIFYFVGLLPLPSLLVIIFFVTCIHLGSVLNRKKNQFISFFQPNKKLFNEEHILIAFSHVIESKKLSIYSTNRTKTNDREVTYVTYFASIDFAPALEVFLYTFHKTKSKYPLAICIPMVESFDKIVMVARNILIKYFGILQWKIYLWPLIPSPQNKLVRSKWAVNWTKLRIWSMTSYSMIFYVDLDTIFMKNIDSVFDIHLENKSLPSFRGTLDWGKWTPLQSKKMNGGVFLVKPSTAVFAQLLSAMEDVKKYKSVEAEQGLINYIFSEKQYCCLPITFNTQKTVSKHIPSAWSGENISILHFTGEKPWNSWSTPIFRNKFVSKHEIAIRRKVDNWDEQEYLYLHNQWKTTYIFARYDEFSQLTLYHTYTQSKPNFKPVSMPSSYLSLLNFRGICLGEKLYLSTDISAKTLCPQLRDTTTRIDLGSFASLLAVYYLPSPQKSRFVGFYWQTRKITDSKYGASIDWTKVDFNTKSIYFWYSSYHGNKSYYDNVNDLFPGIISILRENIDFQLPKIDQSFAVLGNYFIVSKITFDKYMKDAIILKDKLLMKYPSSGLCPFESRTSSIYGVESQFEQCCVCRLLELYVNLWMIHHRHKLVYAVDHPEWRMISQ